MSNSKQKLTESDDLNNLMVTMGDDNGNISNIPIENTNGQLDGQVSETSKGKSNKRIRRKKRKTEKREINYALDTFKNRQYFRYFYTKRLKNKISRDGRKEIKFCYDSKDIVVKYLISEKIIFQ